MGDVYSGELVQTPCPYRLKARYLTEDVRGQSAQSAAYVVGDYASGGTAQSGDVLLLRLTSSVQTDGWGQTLTALHSLLFFANATSLQRRALTNDVQSEKWRLFIRDLPFFALFLSASYSKSHPRYNRGGSVLCLQPESLFDSVLPRSPALRSEVSTTVRRSFAREGIVYSSAHEARIPKSRRIVLNHDLEGLEWWSAPLQAELRV